MGKPLRTAVAVCFLVTLSASSAYGWGEKGHRIVGRLAQKRLENLHPDVMKRIGALVGPGVTLASIANCGDSIRDHKPGNSFPGNCLLTAAEVETQFSKTGSWHFVNIPVPADTNPAAHPTAVLQKACAASAPCITRQIDFFTATLKNKDLSKKSRALALMFLVHLVGDIHQPLHAVARNQDRGGNDVVVKIGSDTRKLHSAWDTFLLNSISESATLSGTVDHSHTTAESWAWESYDAARKTVYKGIPIRPSSDQDPIILPDPAYRIAAVKAIRQRLNAASVRLADLLAASLAD